MDPSPGPPLIIFTITIGKSDPAADDIPSCIKDIPGPDDDVIVL